MTISQTDRFALTQWSDDTDEFTRVQMTQSFYSIAQSGGIFLSGTSASPPSIETSNTRALYWDETNGILYFRGDTLGASDHSWQQIYPTLPAGHVHADLQPLDSDLTAISALSTTGLMIRTGSGSYTPRSIEVSGSGISVTNGDGVAGAPTISVNSTSSSDPNTIVLRNASGNFSAGTITASLSGNATTATTLATARNFSASGDASAPNVSFNGSANTNLVLTLATVNSTVGSFGDSTTVPVITVNAKGLVTSVTTSSIRTGSTAQTGLLQLTDSVSSTSTTTAATPASVKSSYDLANSALQRSGGTMTGLLTLESSSSSTASINIAAGSADPTSPATGDFWNNAGTLKLRTASATKTIAYIDGNVSTASTWQTSRTITLAGHTTGSVTINGGADATLTVTVVNDSHTHDGRYYTETELQAAKLYQYGNNVGGETGGTSGTGLGSTRTTPRIYVQSVDPTSQSGYSGITGDIWFEV